jgi:hypothetical protein
MSRAISITGFCKGFNGPRVYSVETLTFCEDSQCHSCNTFKTALLKEAVQAIQTWKENYTPVKYQGVQKKL